MRKAMRLILCAVLVLEGMLGGENAWSAQQKVTHPSDTVSINSGSVYYSKSEEPTDIGEQSDNKNPNINQRASMPGSNEERPPSDKYKPKTIPFDQIFRQKAINALNQMAVSLKQSPVILAFLIVTTCLFLILRAWESLPSFSTTDKYTGLAEAVNKSIEVQNKLITRLEAIETSKNQTRADDGVAKDKELKGIKDALRTLTTEIAQIKNSIQKPYQRASKRVPIFSLDTSPNFGEDVKYNENMAETPEVEGLPKLQKTIKSQQFVNVCKPIGQVKRIPSESVSPEKEPAYSPSKRYRIPHPKARAEPKPAKLVENRPAYIDENLVKCEKDPNFPDQIAELSLNAEEERSDIEDDEHPDPEDENPFAVIQKHNYKRSDSPKLKSHRTALLQQRNSFCDISRTVNTPDKVKYRTLSTLGWSI